MVKVGPAWQRQIGYLSAEEQDSLGRARVAVLGLGGVGGVAAELLARVGVGSLVVCDPEVFEESNLNRQVGALAQTLGRSKARVMGERLLAINPALRLTPLPPVPEDEEGAAAQLAGCAAAVSAVDRLRPAVALWRAARRVGVPLVECLALPVLQVRCLHPDGPDPEEGWTSAERPLAQVSEDELRRGFWEHESPRWRDGDGEPLAWSPEMALAMQQGGARSLGPLVWLAGAAAALETLKLLTGRGRPAWFPRAACLDPWEWRLSAPWQ